MTSLWHQSHRKAPINPDKVLLAAPQFNCRLDYVNHTMMNCTGQCCQLLDPYGLLAPQVVPLIMKYSFPSPGSDEVDNDSWLRLGLVDYNLTTLGRQSGFIVKTKMGKGGNTTVERTFSSTGGKNSL